MAKFIIKNDIKRYEVELKLFVSEELNKRMHGSP